MTWPKQLEDMDCVESIDALREGLRHLDLPAISLYELFLDHAIQAHKDEVQKAYERGVDSIRLSPDYVGAIGGLSND